jgi:hypothetical protein
MQARIKKIMQLDEEVGKLASATPVMICESALQFEGAQQTTSQVYENKMFEEGFADASDLSQVAGMFLADARR